MATELARRIRGTRPSHGQALRQKWVEARDVECEALHFSDLIPGDCFIMMPTPGDNSGHGGMLNESYLFMKTGKMNRSIFPTNSIRLCDATSVDILGHELVIKVK